MAQTRAGQAGTVSECIMHDLHVTQVQVDELWTSVHKRERMLKAWERLHVDQRFLAALHPGGLARL